ETRTGPGGPVVVLTDSGTARTISGRAKGATFAHLLTLLPPITSSPLPISSRKQPLIVNACSRRGTLFFFPFNGLGCWPSPPARGRGSKRGQLERVAQDRPVAPRAGAWIETWALWSYCAQPASPPARGRGSKRATRHPPTQGGPVAPRAGAWIETIRAIAA